MASKQTITVAVFGEEDLNNGEDLFSVEINTGMVELLVWWIKTAASDFASTVPKIEEYGQATGVERIGSADIRAIGNMYAELAGLADAPPDVKQQMAAWTYLVGKLGRCIANFQAGQLAKPDTTFDSTIYTLMMRRIAETGEWP